MLTSLYQHLEQAAQGCNPERASRFFKMQVGEYAQHDIFYGIPVPILRNISTQYATLDLSDIQKLLESNINEYRFLALLMLIKRYKSNVNNDECYNFYLKNIQYINNWNLVDLSAHEILGRYLYKKSHEALITLAQSSNLWERRIAIVATWHFIRNHSYITTLVIVKNLLNDKEDLIHKSCGWMLREVGKKNQTILLEFLDQHAVMMPRTMLRYAIEKLSKEQQKDYRSMKYTI